MIAVFNCAQRQLSSPGHNDPIDVDTGANEDDGTDRSMQDLLMKAVQYQ